GSRLCVARHDADASRQRPAVYIRNSHHHARPRTAGACLYPQPETRRHRGACAQRRRHPVRAPPHRLRLRHDGLPLGAVAVARQRTVFLFRLGGGEPGRHPQLHGRQIEGGRRHDRRHAVRHRARGLRGGDAGARPRAAFGILCHPALFPAAPMGGALVANRASLAHVFIRLPAGNLVARGRRMILGDILADSERAAAGDSPTLDDLFRRAGVRHPDAIALVDPDNRQSFTDGAPRTLTYAQADRAIGAFAARLRGLGLATDTAVALQLPNTIDGIIALLGTMRARMIAAPVPLLWRQQETIDALGRIGAKAIVTAARIGSVAHGDLAMQVAAELFPIRFVCAFGERLPDGVVPLDDIFGPDAEDAIAAEPRLGAASAHLAMVTFDMGAEGLVPVARSHAQLLAGGLAVHAAAQAPLDAPLLSAIPPSSFAGIALTLVPWLLSGGTLNLHHAFDPAAFAAQCHRQDGGTVVLPGPALAAIAAAGCLGDATKT